MIRLHSLGFLPALCFVACGGGGDASLKSAALIDAATTLVLTTNDASLARVTTTGDIDGVLVPERSTIVKTSSGTSVITIIQVAGQTRVAGQQVPAGSLLLFDTPGRLASVQMPRCVGGETGTVRGADEYIDLNAAREALHASPEPVPGPLAYPQYLTAREGCYYTPGIPPPADSLQQQQLRAAFDVLASVGQGSSPRVAVLEGVPACSDGALQRRFVLLEPVSAGAASVPLGTVISSRRDETGVREVDVFAPRPMALGAIELPARSRATLRRTTSPDYENVPGFITASASFPELQTIAGLCVAPRSWTLFGPNGGLESFLLDCDTEYADYVLPRRTRVIAYDDGAVAVVRTPDRRRLGEYDVEAGAVVCLGPTGILTSIPLAKKLLIRGVEWPAGTRIVRDGGGDYDAALTHEPVPWRGMTFTAERRVFLHPNGMPERGEIMGPVRLGDLPCSERVAFFDDGRFQGCILTERTRVAGVAVRPAWTEVTPTGFLARGLLDQEYRIGTSVFRAGTGFNGVYNESIVREVKNQAQLNELAGRVEGQLDPAVRRALLAQSGKGPFGRFSDGAISLKSSNRGYGRQEVTWRRTYRIVDFVRNPPFQDCDCDVELTVGAEWAIKNDKLRVTGGLKDQSEIVVGCGLCPVGRIALWVAATFGPSISVERRQLLQDSIKRPVDEATALLIQQLTGTVPMLPSSVVLKDLWIQDGKMMGNFEYQRYVR